jgi:hypothetical protein
MRTRIPVPQCQRDLVRSLNPEEDAPVDALALPASTGGFPKLIIALITHVLGSDGTRYDLDTIAHFSLMV